MKKTKPLDIEKSFEEFKKNHELKEITKEDFEKSLKKAVKPKAPAKKQK